MFAWKTQLYWVFAWKTQLYWVVARCDKSVFLLTNSACNCVCNYSKNYWTKIFSFSTYPMFKRFFKKSLRWSLKPGNIKIDSDMQSMTPNHFFWACQKYTKQMWVIAWGLLLQSCPKAYSEPSQTSKMGLSVGNYFGYAWERSPGKKII